MKIFYLILLLLFNFSLFAEHLPHLNLEKYNDEKKKTAIEVANHYYSSNNKNRALSSLKASIKKYEKFYDANIYIAYIYQTKGELNRSLRYIKKAILIDSSKAEAYYYRAQYHLKIGDSLKAINDFATTIISNPNFYYGYTIFNRLKNAPLFDSTYKSSIQILFKEQMESTYYSEANLNFNLALFHLSVGDNHEALNAFNKCLTNKRYKAQSHFSMGLAYYFNRQYYKALSSFSLAAGLNYKTNETQIYVTHISRLVRMKRKRLLFSQKKPEF